jgi:hypothetical protein
VSFTFFNPKTGTYETARAPRTTITITAPANAPAAASNPTAAAPETKASEESAAARESRSENLKSKIPPPPAGIPRDPLPGSEIAPGPLSVGELVAWAAAPFVAVLVFWAGLAFRRARQTDPLRAQREARTRLAATLAQLRSADAGRRPALLLQWQRDAATLWQIPHAAPRASALRDAAWSTLWAESERALYGPGNALPADWVARAEAALAAKRLPGFQPLRLFLPRNLFPFAALVAVALTLSWSLLRAATVDGAAAYRSGDFATAEKTWREAVSRHPTDAFARHNLSLALAQQERLGEAAAQAAAAFVQDPAERAIAWNFGFAAEKSASIPAVLADFVNPGPLHALAARAAPSEWQRVIVGAAFAAALALAGLLLNLYRRRSRAAHWIALALLGVAVLAAATGAASVLAYGEAADARAAIVAHNGTLRSIPTEADTTQKTTPLATGTLAIADKTFLSNRWVHLVFANGQTGWVRREEVVPIWK